MQPKRKFVDDLQQLSVPGERWVSIRDAPGYWISDHGQLATQRKHLGYRYGYGISNQFRLMRCTSGNKGNYPRADLVVGGKKVARLIHCLVLEAFVGPAPAGHQCRHLDDDPKNNKLENLRWGTAKENSEDRTKNGRTARGSRSGRSKLTEDMVLTIWQRYALGELPKHIAEMFGVKTNAIHAILLGQTWKHVKV